MKSIKSILAAISITWAILFSCRLVMIATPLNLVEEIAVVMTMIEFSFYKSKELEKNDEEE